MELRYELWRLFFILNCSLCVSISYLHFIPFSCNEIHCFVLFLCCCYFVFFVSVHIEIGAAIFFPSHFNQNISYGYNCNFSSQTHFHQLVAISFRCILTHFLTDCGLFVYFFPAFPLQQYVYTFCCCCCLHHMNIVDNTAELWLSVEKGDV